MIFYFLRVSFAKNRPNLLNLTQEKVVQLFHCSRYSFEGGTAVSNLKKKLLPKYVNFTSDK